MGSTMTARVQTVPSGAGIGNVRPFSGRKESTLPWCPADQRPQATVLTDNAKAKHAASMSAEALCQHIETVIAPAVNALKDNVAYLAEAHKRFSQRGRQIPIPGKPTWGEWIEANLGISDRHVRRLLAVYRDPTKKTKGQKAKKTSNAFLALAAVRLAKLVLAGNIAEAKDMALKITEAQKKSPASVPSEVLQSLTVEGCRGCEKLHRGVLNVANEHPDWDMNRVSEFCAVSTVVVRQGLIRFDWAIDEGEVA